MARTLYALLVGIDAYPSPVAPLSGCVNDITHVHEYLRTRTGGDGDRYEPLLLTDAKATRPAVIAGFRTHLSRAGSSDVVLFYYSGHGARQKCPPEFWHLQPDRLMETLVCYDSRQKGGWDLADKELALLIAEVAAGGAHVVVVLDCCHSGSGTRALAPEHVAVRLAQPDYRDRPPDAFIVSPGQATQLAGGAVEPAPAGTQAMVPRGRHVVLSACQPNELAKELTLDGQRRGIFSYYLLDTLQQHEASLTYRDVFKRAGARVRAGVSAQSPVLEATQTEDLEQPFLGGAIRPGQRYFTVSFDGTDWVMDGGTIHGIAVGAGGDSTTLAVFPLGTALPAGLDVRSAAGQATVAAVFPGRSTVRVRLAGGGDPDPGLTYKALVTSVPLPPLVVNLDGDAGAVRLVQEALAVTEPGAPQWLALGTPAEASLRVVAANGRFTISRPGDAYPLVVDTPYGPDGAAGARLVVYRLEHMARWLRVVQLANKTSLLPARAAQLDIVAIGPEGNEQAVGDTGEVQLAYYFRDGKWQRPRFRIRLRNTGTARLYFSLFDLRESYGIIPLLPGGGIWLDPEQETWVTAEKGSTTFYASVPKALWEGGVTQFRDTLKLIASTEEIDATLLAQNDLPVSLPQTRSAGAGKAPTVLQRLLKRARTRHLGGEAEEDEPVADWMTAEVSFIITRPLAAVNVAQPGRTLPLAGGVTVAGHPGLKAHVRLASWPEASRDAGPPPLPPLLGASPHTGPFELGGTGHRGASGLSVLEISGMENPEVVTRQNPLVVHTDNPLAAREHLLPVAFDGTFYLPVGHARNTATGTEIRIERLPLPTGTDNRSLTGSIRIFFQKIINPRLGLEYPYPLLAEASISARNAIVYNADRGKIARKVEQAGRILLLVHGIIGDTQGMTACTRPDLMDPAVLVPALSGHYDLVLTFDYENIHTSIEDNARFLKGRLEEVGLGPDHAKLLHVVAHSMGGLVSRWFIEREGGNKVVQHLVMLGTPNGGSPWANIQDWATLALGIALNSIAAVAWPVQVLGALVSVLEAVDVSLDQMKPGSGLLKNLASSPDPHVPYTLIAGQTSIIPAALEGGEAGLLARLWSKLNPQRRLYDAAGLAFFGRPNDIAASVESIYAVPANRDPQPVHHPPVACDHLTYFSSEVGLTALTHGLGLKEGS